MYLFERLHKFNVSQAHRLSLFSRVKLTNKAKCVSDSTISNNTKQLKKLKH